MYTSQSMSRKRPARNQTVRLTGVVEGIRHGYGNGQSGDLGVSDVASIEKGQEVGDSKRGQDSDLGGAKGNKHKIRHEAQVRSPGSTCTYVHLPKNSAPFFAAVEPLMEVHELLILGRRIRPSVKSVDVSSTIVRAVLGVVLLRRDFQGRRRSRRAGSDGGVGIGIVKRRARSRDGGLLGRHYCEKRLRVQKEKVKVKKGLRE
jgi:hypothetical protein